MDPQLDRAYRAFLNFTLAKRRECFKDFSEGQRDAFSLIPYLLQSSEPKRFGYVEGKLAPYGIHGYHYSDEVKTIGRRYFSSRERFEEPKSIETAPMLSLSIMGSAGSIAQTEGSDLDYWLCIRDDLRREERRLLQLKLTAIEKWCMSDLNAEVHFFVSTASDLAKNNFGAVDKESCGTALGKLLKEEYYRTSLHVAGQIPLWWLAPYNANEEVYAKLSDRLGHGPGVSKKDFVDFGNCRMIPRDEFVGGGMWQLNKGVGSPFKSALKMGLLVEYSDDQNQRDLLAQMLKRRMFENPGDVDQLDPYRMMVERVLQIYGDRKDSHTELLLQRCLFIKMETKVSRWWDSRHSPPHRTVRTLLEMVKSWGWSLRDVQRWEDFDVMAIREKVKFKRDLEKYMFTSLQELRSGSGKDLRSVSELDFRKMTQRLTTIFNPDPTRTEWFYPPYQSMIKADAYTLREEIKEKVTQWVLYSGVVDNEGKVHGANARKRLQNSSSLAELTTWMLYNQLIREETQVAVHHRRKVPFTGNLKRLARAYREKIGKTELPTLDSDAFAHDSCPKQWMVVVNLVPVVEIEVEDARDEDEAVSEEDQSKKGLSTLIAGELAEALTEAGFSEKAQELRGEKKRAAGEEEVRIGSKLIPLRAGRVPSSEDPFNAGPESGSVFNELFALQLNTWGEVFTVNIGGDDPVCDVLAHICSTNLRHAGNIAPVHCELGFGPYHQRQTQERFRSLIEGSIAHICSATTATPIALFQLNSRYVKMIRVAGDVDFSHHESFGEALMSANLGRRKDVRLWVDEGHPRLVIHQTMISRWREGENLLHLMDSRDGCMICCVDQTGRYFYDTLEKADFNLQWPPLLLSLLGAIRQQPSEVGRGKLRITRGMIDESDGQEVTQQLFKVIQGIRDKLPRTKMVVNSEEAMEWLQKGAHDDLPESISLEIEATLAVHRKAQGATPLVLSNVEMISTKKESAQGDWPPALQLQLRQALIRAARRRQQVDLKSSEA